MHTVSVIIPTYNRGHILQRAIRSVLTQEIAATELIIVDDGSEDNTQSIIQGVRLELQGQHENRSPRLISLTQTNQGVSAARNAGIEAASSEWIAFLDADDEWLPHNLTAHLQLLRGSSKTHWCATGHAHVRDTSQLHYRGSNGVSGLVDFWSFARYGDPLPSTLLIRRTVIEQVGGFDPSLRISEDRDLAWRIAQIYPCIGFDSRITVIKHIDAGGSLMAGSSDRTDSIRTIVMNARRYVDSADPAADNLIRHLRPLVWGYAFRQRLGAVRIQEPYLQDMFAAFPSANLAALLGSASRQLPGPISSIAIKTFGRGLQYWRRGFGAGKRKLRPIDVGYI